MYYLLLSVISDWIEYCELCLIFEIACLWRSARHVFIRLILPVFLFEAVLVPRMLTGMNKVEHEWQ